MAEPLFLRPGVAAVQCAKRLSTPCGNRILRARCRQYKTTRGIATAAAVQEPVVDFPSQSIELPPQQPERTRKDDLKHAKPFSDFLTDTFNRQHDYLRISITERCNLRCLYCMPEEGVPLSPPSHLLTTPEITYLSALFVSQGVTKIRLTGGEPTVRSDILPLMRSIGALRSRGLKELALTTNGISLHRKLDAMVEAGLTGVNLSLDTLDPFQFQIMTRRRGFEAVMKSVERILEMNKLDAGVKLKINCVVMRGLNEREILPFVEMTRDKDIEVRFIEYMPFDGNRWSQGKMLPYREMLEIIRGKYPEVRRVQGHKNDTSKTFEIPGFVGRLGFITSMTHNFCGSCNRLRITSDGNLKVCLFGNAEVSLRDLLRKDNSGLPMDEQAFEALKQVEMDRRQGLLGETPLGFSARERELLDVIGMAVKRKKEKHAGMGALENMKNRPMILIDESKRLPAKLPFPSRISLRRTSYNIIAAPSSQWTLIPTTLLPSNRLPTIHSLTHHAHFSTTSCAAKPSLKTTSVSSLRSSLSQRSASVAAAPTHTSDQQLAAKAEDTRNLQRNERLVRRTNNPAPLWGGRGQQWKKVAGKGWERKKAKMARRREGREWEWESMGGVIVVRDSRKGGPGKGESKREEYARKAAERAARRAERKRQGDEAEMVAVDEAAMVGMEEGEQGIGEKGALWEDAVVTPDGEVEQEQPRPDPPARLTRQQRLRARAAGKGREMSEEDDAFDTQGVREPRLDVLMKQIEKREAAGPIGRMMEMEMEAKMDEEMEERNKRRVTILEAWEREVEAEKTEAGKGGIEKQEPQEKRTNKAEAESSRDELEQEFWRQRAATSEAFEKTRAWIQTHNPDPAIFVPKPPWTKRDIAEAKGAKAMLLKTEKQKVREKGAEKLRMWMARTKPTVEKTKTGPAEAEMIESGKMRAGTEGPDTTDAQQRAGFATYNPPVEKIGEYKGKGLADGEQEAETQIRREHTGSSAASEALEPDTESQRKAQADKPWKLYDNFIDSTDDVAEDAPASTGGEETSQRKAAAEGNKDAYKPAEAEIFVVQANENKPTSLGVTKTNITAQRRAVVAKPAIPLIDRTAEDPFTESKTTRKRKAAPKADENEPDMLVGENSEEPALTIERRTASEEVLRDAPKPIILAHGAISEAKKEWFRLQISKRDGQVRELENQINSVEKYVSLIEEKRRTRWEEAVAASRLQNVRRRVLDLAEKVWDNHAAIRGMKGQLGAIMLPVRARQAIPSMEGKVEESEQTLRSLDEEVIRAGVLIRALRAGLVQLTQAMPVVDNTTTTAVHDTADKPHAVASVAEMDEISPGVIKHEEPSTAIRRLKSKKRRSGRGIRGNEERKLLHDYNYGWVPRTLREIDGGHSGMKQKSPTQTQEDPHSAIPELDNLKTCHTPIRLLYYDSTFDPSQTEHVDPKEELVKNAQNHYSMRNRTKPPDNPPKRPTDDELIEHVRKLGKPVKITRYRLSRPHKGGISTILDTKAKMSGEDSLVRFHLNVPRPRLIHTSARRLDETRTPSLSSSTNTTPTASSDDHTSSSPSLTSPSDQKTPTPHLTHLTPAGTAHMVAITNKSTTHRVAIAVGEVRFSNPDPCLLIAANALKKGDVLAVARIAGIMAAKATPTLIPLCHPIQITKVAVDVWLDETLGGEAEVGKEQGGLKAFGGVKIEARVECQGQTGVEMEALTAVSVAGLTVFDMCKAVDRGMVIDGVRVVSKSGGKSGDWVDGRRMHGGRMEGGGGTKRVEA